MTRTMLTRRIETPTRFTRSDIPRLAIAAGILILALAAILGADILPDRRSTRPKGQLATRDIVAPARDRLREHGPDRARRGQAASAAVPFQYDFTTENAIAIAAAQQLAFESRVARIDTTFSADLSPDGPQVAPPDRRAGPVRTRPRRRSSASTPRAGPPSGPRRPASSTRR